MAAKGHELARCLVSELGLFTGSFGKVLSMRDFTHCDEICTQLYMDTLGHGINSALPRR